MPHCIPRCCGDRYLASNVQLSKPRVGRLRFKKDFAARVTADLKISHTERVSLALSCDDGCRMLVDGEEVLNNDGLHGEVSRLT